MDLWPSPVLPPFFLSKVLLERGTAHLFKYCLCLLHGAELSTLGYSETP